MLKQIKDGNYVKIEGILSEIDLKTTSYVKDGVKVEAIGGSIKVRVETVINGENTEIEVPVYLFSNKMTKESKPNPAYTSIEKVMNEFVSIASSSLDQADRVRINGAQIRMNEYYNENGNFTSFPRINASFVNKISKNDCKPEATFNVTFAVGNKDYELDRDGVPTDKYKVTGLIPQYGGKVDVVPFVTYNKGVIDAISSYWQPGDTVKATGRLNFSSKTEVKTIPVDFGEPIEKTQTITVSDLIITGGSQTPLEGEFAINEQDLNEALAARKAYLAEQKEKAANKTRPVAAPAASANKFSDLGF